MEIQTLTSGQDSRALAVLSFWAVRAVRIRSWAKSNGQRSTAPTPEPPDEAQSLTALGKSNGHRTTEPTTRAYSTAQRCPDDNVLETRPSV